MTNTHMLSLNLTNCVKEVILGQNKTGDNEHLNLYEGLLSRPPLFTTVRLNTLQGKTNEDIIEEIRSKFGEACTEKGWLPFAVSHHPDIPDVAVIAGRGPMPREKCTQEVIVDHWCGSAVLRGADVFAQGIKAAPANMKAGDKVSVYADLEGKCKKGLVKTYEGHKFYVGNGLAQVSRHQLFVEDETLSGVGISMTEPLYESPSLSDLLPSLVFPQNLPSAVTVCVLDPQPSDRVLDMCAAPGGKTTHIAARMSNTGQVFALDKTESKVDKIKANAAKWNLTNIKTFSFDATTALSTTSDMTDVPPFPPESFDRILLDGPCSALGQRPMLVNTMSHKQLQSYPRLQKSLLTTAVALLRPSGTLVYSTCTVTVEENEEMVAWALNKFPCLQLVHQKPHIGGHGRKVSTLTDEDCQKLQLFNPYRPEDDRTSQESQTLDDTSTVYEANSSLPDMDVNSDTIGFFIAKFIKCV